MLIRIAVYLLSLTVTHYVIGFVFSRNFMQGIYPPEADSISIAIFTNQILLYGIAMFILPTAILGSRWFINKAARTHLLLRLLVVLAFAALYAASMIVCMNLTLDFLDGAHIELGLSYLLISLAVLGFAVWDVIRIYKDFFRRRAVNTLDKTETL